MKVPFFQLVFNKVPVFQVDLVPSQVICLFCLPNIPVFQIPSKLPSLKLFLLKNGWKYVKSTIKEETIQNISQFLNNNSKKGNYLKFKCNNCGTFHKYDKEEFDLDFDCIGGSERSMGTENQYEAIENFKCNCGNNITAKPTYFS